MKSRLILLLIPILVIASIAKQSNAQDWIATSPMAPRNDVSPPIPGNWELSFSDDFDYLNQNNWNTTLPKDKITLGGSICFFLEENVAVANGNLMIISKKHKLELKNPKGQIVRRKYSSGQINSFSKFAQQYGYFEARIKLPSKAGLWPAFWLMPNRIDPKLWSTYSIKDKKGMEIDIMENLSEWGQHKFHYAAHWDGYKEDRRSWSGEYNISSPPDKDGYRRFGLYWGENILIWFVDGIEVHRWVSDRIANIPMHLIISTEMGGWATNRIKDLPDITYIDYVKVWTGEAKLNPIQKYNIYHDSVRLNGKWKHQQNHLISKKPWFRNKNKVNSISWDINVDQAGRYKIYAKWPESKVTLAKEANFLITHAADISEIKINQNNDYNYYVLLGEFQLSEGQEHLVITSKAKDRVAIEAIRYEQLE